MLKRRSSRYPTPAQKREREAWSHAFDYCWICGCREMHPLQTHEIASRAKAPNKWADVRNYVRTCPTCHSEVFSWLPEAAQIALKKRHDQENYDRVFINRIRGRADDAVSEGEVRLWLKLWEIIQR